MRTRKKLHRKTSLRPKVANPRKTRTRKPSEFSRIYGSRERVAFVAGLPCVVCGLRLRTVGGCHNAHIETGGMGRKADYTKIIPLCPTHHRAQHAKGWDAIGVDDYLRRWFASWTERQWQAHLRGER